MSTYPLLGRRPGRAAAARPARGPERDQHARCSTSSSPTWPRRAPTTRSARWSSPRPTTWGSPPAPTCASGSSPRRRCGGWSSSRCSTTSSPRFRSPPSRPATAPASAAGAEIAVCCDLRVGGGNLRLRFPGRGARRPGRPRAPGHALRALGREVPAADGEGGRRRHGLPLGPGAQGGAGGAHRGGGAAARRSGGREPAGGGREAEADAARARRGRGPLAAEGEGQVTGRAPARAPFRD